MILLEKDLIKYQDFYGHLWKLCLQHQPFPIGCQLSKIEHITNGPNLWKEGFDGFNIKYILSDGSSYIRTIDTHNSPVEYKHIKGETIKILRELKLNEIGI